MISMANQRPEMESVAFNLLDVNFLEEDDGTLKKRRKVHAPPMNQSQSGNAIGMYLSQHNPLDGPPPLGLKLKNSPSFLDLVQTRVDLDDARKHRKGGAAADKLKASNFSASLLRIGQWQYKSLNEGDLVAKCYFAKHKLVWEVLENGLKSKIEIQWSDITALKANFPVAEEELGTLTVVLARQPLFFRETNPQPRKHTMWRASWDFTGGEASTYRQHFLLCPQRVLNKHYEKLIQCDPRLFFLSHQPDISPDSPFFEAADSGNTEDCDNETKGSALQLSNSVSDFMSHMDQCLSGNASELREEILDIAQCLLADTQLNTLPSDGDKSLMKKVNSLCCLLQKDCDPKPQAICEDENQYEHVNSKGMSGEDSFGDALLDLPRIESFPYLL